MNKRQLLGLEFSVGSYYDFNKAIIEIAQGSSSSYVCVANVHMLVEAKRSLQFAKIVNEAEIITPDGKPLTWAFSLLYGMRQDRVAGMDLLPDLLTLASQKDIPVFFYGGTLQLLGAAEKYIYTTYPTLKVAGFYSPPFRDLTREEELEVANRINRSGAKLVFVILGCPKQEKWMATMKGSIRAVMIGLGGALPVLIGSRRRAPLWMQQKGLEWLFRMGQEPRRLFKRYAITNAIFCWLVLRAWARQGFTKK